MLRHSRLRYAGAISQGVNCLFPVARQALKYRPTSRVGEGFEDIVRYGLHSRSITKRLLIVNTLTRPCEVCAKVARGAALDASPYFKHLPNDPRYQKLVEQYRKKQCQKTVSVH